MIDLKGASVLVTGATGLLGRPLVDALLERGAFVCGVGFEYQPWDWPSKANYIRADLSDRDKWTGMVYEVDYVFHLAGAKGGVGIGQAKAADFLRGNILSTINLYSEILSESPINRPKRVLFTSSVGAYPGATWEFNEADDLWLGAPHPSDFFGGVAKRVGEAICEAHRRQHGIDYVIVRPTNCYGPYDRFDAETGMVIAALIARLEAGENPLMLWGDGSQRRDFLYSIDCAEGMIRAMERGESGEAYNLGTGVALALYNVIGGLAESYPSLDVAFDDNKPTGPKIRCMNMAKSFRALGNFLKYDDISGLHRAIGETVAWYRANKNYQTYDPFK